MSRFTYLIAGLIVTTLAVIAFGISQGYEITVYQHHPRVNASAPFGDSSSAAPFGSKWTVVP